MDPIPRRPHDILWEWGVEHDTDAEAAATHNYSIWRRVPHSRPTYRVDGVVVDYPAYAAAVAANRAAGFSEPLMPDYQADAQGKAQPLDTG